MYSIVQLPLQNMADGDAGIAAHVHYDPYFPRLLSHVKRLLAQKYPYPNPPTPWNVLSYG